MKTKLFIGILLGLNSVIYSQGFDVDSFFTADASAREFFKNFNISQLDNFPNWDKIITYKDLGWKELTMRIYNSKDEGNSNPCLLFIHGGGWETRAVNQYMHYAWYFSNKGYITAALEYRVFNDSSVVTPQDEIEDAKSAVRYIRENAEELRIDPEKIVVVGMSAGGHLAASTVFIEGFDAPGENTEVSSEPNALMMQNPAIDLSESGWVDGNHLLGDDWLKLSPLHHVDSDCNSVPSLLMSGSADNLTPVSGMKEWDLRYHKRGCESYLYIFEGRGHGFGNYAENKSGEGHRDFIYSLYLMQNFLAATGMCNECNTSIVSSLTINNSVIYPNPAHEQLFISSGKTISNIFIYSSNGNVQQEFSLNSDTYSINLNKIDNGLKLVRIIYKGGLSETYYLVKQ